MSVDGEKKPEAKDIDCWTNSVEWNCNGHSRIGRDKEQTHARARTHNAQWEIHAIWLIRQNYIANNVHRIHISTNPNNTAVSHFYCHSDCNSITKIYCSYRMLDLTLRIYLFFIRLIWFVGVCVCVLCGQNSNRVIETQSAGNSTKNEEFIGPMFIYSVYWIHFGISYLGFVLSLSVFYDSRYDTLSNAMLYACVSHVLSNVNRKKNKNPVHCLCEHLDFFLLIQWRAEKPKFLSGFLCFSQFIKTYTMLLKMYCWPIFSLRVCACERGSVTEKRESKRARERVKKKWTEVYLSEMPNKWKSIEWQKLFASDIVVFFSASAEKRKDEMSIDIDSVNEFQWYFINHSHKCFWSLLLCNRSHCLGCRLPRYSCRNA